MALAAGVCHAQPNLLIVSPPEGAQFIAGNDVPLTAMVTNNGSAVTQVSFLANGSAIGLGQPDPHGEWSYVDGSHLSVMAGFFGEGMDYSSPGMSEFFTMSGSFVTPLVFVGEFTTWAAGSHTSGPVTVTLSFTANGELNAAMNGPAPLGQRTLTAGVRGDEGSPYRCNWPEVAAGSYELRAVARYGASQSVTSAPVNITVSGGKAHGSIYVQNLTFTGAHGGEWQDKENQLGLSWSGVHVAWMASATGTNGITTNRVYHARSLDNGATWQPWTLVEERTASGYASIPQWMAVDGNDVHLLTITDHFVDGGSVSHGQRLQYHRSTDGGASFEPVQVLGTTVFGENYNQALISASDGYVSIAVSFSKAEHPNALKFLCSTNGGASFTGTEALTSLVGIYLSQLQQSGSRIFLTWDSFYYGGFWYDGAAQLTSSSDAGATFSTVALETPPAPFVGGNHGNFPRAAVEGLNVCVAYIFENTNATPSHGELLVRCSTDGGLSFGPPVNVAPDLVDPFVELPADADYDIAMDGSNISVVFATTGYRTYLARSTNGGTSFLPPQLLATPSMHAESPMLSQMPRIAQRPWQRSQMSLLWGGTWFMHSTNGGASWTPPVQLMLKYAYWRTLATPQLVVDYQGVVHWTQTGWIPPVPGPGDYDVLYRRFNPAPTPPGYQNFAAQLGYVSGRRFDNLQIPAVPALQFGHAFSIETWVKFSARSWSNHTSTVIAQRSVSPSEFDPFAIYITGAGDDSVRFFSAYIGLTNGSMSRVLGAPGVLIQPEAWYHVALTFDAAGGQSNLNLYVNGQLADSAEANRPLPTSTALIRVGTSDRSTDFMDGAVDDLRFWNRALTAQEIRNRFTGPLGGDEAGLAAYYTFDGTWADVVGNALPAVPMFAESFGDGADVEPMLAMETLPGGQVRLSWVTFNAAYAVKSCASLATPDWQPVDGTPSMVNGRWTLTVDATGNAQFFRLQRN